VEHRVLVPRCAAMRATLLTNILPPYREPVFAELHRRLDGGLRVVCLAERESNRNWDFARDRYPFPVRVLRGFALRGRRPDRVVHVTQTLGPELVLHRPDALVIGGFDQPMFFDALLAAKLLRIPVVLWSGAHRGTVSDGPAMLLRRLMVRGADAYVS